MLLALTLILWVGHVLFSLSAIPHYDYECDPTRCRIIAVICALASVFTLGFWGASPNPHLLVWLGCGCSLIFAIGGHIFWPIIVTGKYLDN